MDYTRLGKRIKEERLRLNLTQEKLSEKVGISTAYLGQIERGERCITLDKLIPLANYLGVTVDFLLTDYIVTDEDNSLNILTQLFRGKTVEEKELAVKSFDHWHEYNLVQKPEMGDLVRDLKAKGYGIYLCSNASVRMLTCYKEVLPAVECFDGILFSAEVLCMKPQKEMYGHFFERFGLKPEECYFIDDLPNNIAGAKACGMDGYCFADGDVEKLKRTLYESVLS